MDNFAKKHLCNVSRRLYHIPLPYDIYIYIYTCFFFQGLIKKVDPFILAMACSVVQPRSSAWTSWLPLNKSSRCRVVWCCFPIGKPQFIGDCPMKKLLNFTSSWDFVIFLEYWISRSRCNEKTCIDTESSSAKFDYQRLSLNDLFLRIPINSMDQILILCRLIPYVVPH